MTVNKNIQAFFPSGMNPFSCFLEKILDGEVKSVFKRQCFMIGDENR